MVELKETLRTLVTRPPQAPATTGKLRFAILDDPHDPSDAVELTRAFHEECSFVHAPLAPDKVEAIVTRAICAVGLSIPGPILRFTAKFRIKHPPLGAKDTAPKAAISVRRSSWISPCALSQITVVG